VPPFDDYRLTNRTYRDLRERPLYAFGYGLSYTSFAYHEFDVRATSTGIAASIEIENVGGRAGDEVVQLYVTRPAADDRRPIRQLVAFARLHLAPGERRALTLDAPAKTYAFWDGGRSTFAVFPGDYDVQIGAASDDIRFRGRLTLPAATVSATDDRDRRAGRGW
jgi:beta-glucosidase